MRTFRPSLSPQQQFAVVSLAVMLLLGIALAALLSAQIEQQMARAAADMVGHQVSAMVRAQIRSEDLRAPIAGQRYKDLHDFLVRSVISDQVARVKIWSGDGVVVYADDPTLVGQRFAPSEDLRAALSSNDVIVGQASPETAEDASERNLGPLLEIYAPLTPADARDVEGAYEVYLHYAPIAAAVWRAQLWIWASVGVSLLVLWLSLWWVFARASRTILAERERALTDPLTQLHNRRALLERLEREHDRRRRFGVPFSLIMLDLDHFKRYNDAHGHPAGDEALRALGECLRRCVRSVDMVARIGGEEFAILLSGTDASRAELTARRIREQAAAVALPFGAMTVSQGVATCLGGDETLDIIAAADAALYQAKRQGRNCVCAAPAALVLQPAAAPRKP